jgi:hypothetical protein
MSLEKPKALIVDDDCIYRVGTLERLARNAGYDCVSVGHIKKAEEALDGQIFNLLILDTIGVGRAVVGPSIAKYAVNRMEMPRIIALSANPENVCYWKDSGVPHEFYDKLLTQYDSFVDILKKKQ